MKITMSLIIFLLNSFSFANNPIYDLKMELSLNENRLSPRIIVKEGETASITQDSNGQKFYQVHLGKNDYLSGGVRVLPFVKFCQELSLP